MKKALIKNIETSINQVEHLTRKFGHTAHVNVTDLHDLRVGLRKIQTAARLVSFEKKAHDLKKIRSIASQTLKATGKLRDAQVLRTTLRGKKFRPWVIHETRSISMLEKKTSRVLAGHISDHFLKTAHRRIIRPLDDYKGRKIVKFSRFRLKKECYKLEKMSKNLKKNRSNPGFLHRFRIRVKRFRYLLGLLGPVLARDSHKVEAALKKAQNDFGRLHDLDYAIALLRRDHHPSLKDLYGRRSDLFIRALRSGEKIKKMLLQRA